MGSPSTQDITGLLAGYLSSITYESLPGDVVHALKRMVLNTLAAIISGNTLGEGTKELLAWAREGGGSPQSTVLGFGDKVPAGVAAMVNGGMGHSTNYDDANDIASVHLGPVSLPPALAAAELMGGTSGREFLAALAAGAELTIRLGLALGEVSGNLLVRRMPIQVPGYFGAAVSAGRLMKFSAQEMHSALGFALMQAAGADQPAREGKPGKAIYLGFSNHGGMLSAMLARQGLRCDCAAFEGDWGLFHTFSKNGEFFRPALERGLGDGFYLLHVGFKAWPTTARSHAFIEAAIELRDTNHLDVASIESVRVRGSGMIRNFCDPAAVRCHPQSRAAAADSIPFPVAKALIHGKVSLGDLAPTAEGLHDREAIRVAQLVNYELDESLGRAGIVEVTTREGAHHTSRVDQPLGHWLKPLSDKQLIEKFFECSQYAGRPLSRGALEDVVDKVNHLEKLSDVKVIADLLG